MNKNPQAIELLRQNPDRIYWYGLAQNRSPEAMQLFRENPDKININDLSSNSAAIDLLRQNMGSINWMDLSYNPSAINLLKQNPQNIDWYQFSGNPSIFVNLDECARKIQKAFRKSKKYAEWDGHPDRLSSRKMGPSVAANPLRGAAMEGAS